MPVRMTGMISGLDTESLIKGMVDAQKIKNKRTTDKSTLLEWKQEKWKDLNAKIYKLYTEDLGKLRMTSAYGTKNVTSSNENVVSITGGSSAPVGTHTIENIILAKSQMMTSAELKVSDNTKATSSTKLRELVGGLDIEDGTVLTFQSGSKDSVSFEITEDKTITDLVTSMKKAGLNANFDSQQGRLFISANGSGIDNAFKMEATYNQDVFTDKNVLKNAVNYSNLTKSQKEKIDAAFDVLGKGISTQKAYVDAETLVLESVKNAKKASFTDIKYDELINDPLFAIDEDAIRADVIEEHKDDDSLDDEALEKLVKKAIDGKRAEVEASVKSIAEEHAIAEVAANEEEIINTAKAYITSYQASVSAVSDADAKNGVFEKLGLVAITEADLNKEEGFVNGDGGCYFIPGKNSSFTYNGINITNSSNVVSLNGFSITLKAETALNEKINFTSNNNTQVTYDMVKNFIKNYNSLLKEMNDLYYAESSRGYDPLSDEEMEAMSEKQIEKWESKIKDSLLRRDNTLSSLSSVMRLSMTSSYVVNGKNVSLSNLGIVTSTDYTEKGLLHIQGDSEDGLYSSYENKLMKALEEDPDSVIELMTQLSGKLYSELDSKMSAIPNVRSKFTVYNDKLMAQEQTKHKKKIAELEKKLVDMENKYYKQFAAMETAMAKLQSQSNNLAAMLGTSTTN